MWVARRTTAGIVEEVVVDYIVERKNVIDLASSLDDGRYKEQKFRLNKCGIRNKIYLVEGNFEGNRFEMYVSK
jgi:crossover junction endonuclease MUS81